MNHWSDRIQILCRGSLTLPYQVRPSDYQSDLDNMCLTVVRTGGGASNMNIHYDVTGLLTVVWRSHSGQIVWAARIGQGGGEF